jgi:hypothetical protein
MRWFSAFFLLLNAIVLCSSLMYWCYILTYLRMCNMNIVYRNMCMFWYKNIQCYIVYMNSIIRLCWKKGCPSHVYVLEAKSFLYSLPYSYEQPKLWTTSQTMMRRLGCLNVCLYKRNVQSNLEKQASFRILWYN